MNITYKVEGLKELESALLKLSEEFGPKKAIQTLRPALKKAVTPLHVLIEQSTPRDTGTLAESTRTSIGKPSKGEMKSELFDGNIVIVARVGWSWSGKRSMRNQALAVEFGTTKMSGSATIRNSFDKSIDQIISDFRKELGPQIEKMAAKLGKG